MFDLIIWLGNFLYIGWHELFFVNYSENETICVINIFTRFKVLLSIEFKKISIIYSFVCVVFEPTFSIDWFVNIKIIMFQDLDHQSRFIFLGAIFLRGLPFPKFLWRTGVIRILILSQIVSRSLRCLFIYGNQCFVVDIFDFSFWLRFFTSLSIWVGSTGIYKSFDGSISSF